jgi:hypothetical protein
VKERGFLEDQSIDERIILKYDLKEVGWKVDSNGSV